MEYPYYKDQSLFRPSNSTLMQWLRTRKVNNDGSGKPGLFQTVEFAQDQLWSAIALLVELTAIGLTLSGSFAIYSRNPKPIVVILAVIVVLLFVFFDVIGILLHSQDRPDKVIAKNNLVITTSPRDRAILIEKIARITNSEFLGLLLIGLSAALKIFALMQFVVEGSYFIPIIFTIFYLIVFYIHINHTGYWLYALIVSNRLKKEHSRYWDSFTQQIDNVFSVSEPVVEIFESSQAIPGNQTNLASGRQQVNFLQKINAEDGGVLFQYELKSLGILLDEDVNNLLPNLAPAFRKSLIEACIRLQLRQLNAA